MKNCDRGLENHATRGRSIFKPRSKLVLQIKNGLVYTTLSLNRLTRLLLTICKNLRNEQVTQLLDNTAFLQTSLFLDIFPAK